MGRVFNIWLWRRVVVYILKSIFIGFCSEIHLDTTFNGGIWKKKRHPMSWLVKIYFVRIFTYPHYLECWSCVLLWIRISIFVQYQPPTFNNCLPIYVYIYAWKVIIFIHNSSTFSGMVWKLKNILIFHDYLLLFPLNNLEVSTIFFPSNFHTLIQIHIQFKSCL